MKMTKWILAAATALITQSALAHPQAHNGLESLGAGTTLTITKAINLPANESHIRIGEYVDGKAFTSTFCYIKAKKVEAYDREVALNTRLTVTGVELVVGGTESYQMIDYKIKFAENSNFEFTCSKMLRNLHKGYATMGDFTEAISGTARIQLATPRPF